MNNVNEGKLQIENIQNDDVIFNKAGTVTDTGHPLRLSLLGRLQVGHSLVRPHVTNVELTVCNSSKQKYYPPFPIHTCLP